MQMGQPHRTPERRAMDYMDAELAAGVWGAGAGEIGYAMGGFLGGLHAGEGEMAGRGTGHQAVEGTGE